MISRRDGDWMVTTPIYVGTTEDIQVAIACPHEKYEPQNAAQDLARGIVEIVFERCVKCCARRVRYKTTKKEAQDAERDDRCE
jgi:ferredoxin-like protein FixX